MKMTVNPPFVDNDFDKMNGQQLFVNIHPNPAKSVLNINVANGDSDFAILVTDVMGRKVYKQANSAKPIVLNVGSWIPGSYFVKVVAGGKVVVRKVLVAK